MASRHGNRHGARVAARRPGIFFITADSRNGDDDDDDDAGTMDGSRDNGSAAEAMSGAWGTEHSVHARVH